MEFSTSRIERIKALRSEGVSKIYCKGIFLSAKGFLVSELAGKGVYVVVMPTRETAEYMANDLYNLLESQDIYYIPENVKAVEKSSYKSTLSVQRTTAISSLVEAKSGSQIILVSYPEALSARIPAKTSSLLNIKVGKEYTFDKIQDTLVRGGFTLVDFVSAPGEYAMRGGIIDVFSFSADNPFRINFFGDEVDSINYFSTSTQLSTESLREARIYADLSNEDSSKTVTISDILPDDALLFFDSSDMYSDTELFHSLQRFPSVWFDVPLNLQTAAESVVDFDLSPQPVFNKNFDLLVEDVRHRSEEGYKVCIYSEKQSQADRLYKIFSEYRTIMPEFIVGKTLYKGFIDNEEKICHYTDHEIFDRFLRARIRHTIQKSEQLTLNDLNSFNIGDYIVHIDYGVGIFGGLVRKKDEYGRDQEAIKITYKDGDIIFLSIHALNKISKFRSKDSEAPSIHRLGSKTWQNLKATTKKKVKDIAKDLISLYAQRKQSKGFAFSADNYLMSELESSFIYEDTPDQQSAIAATKRDMEDSCPMDRLVCGDVGFGKTEVAIRAAFKAVCDGKQVAVLVPTTILAFQHYNTFRERLKKLPVRVDYVSRLRRPKEITEVRKDLASGKIDILIGTHKILSKDFEFKDLGLLIVDEEQKFGVSSKEKIRQTKINVDTLTLTATPIPRTLQFSLLGARDLSIIATPPANRIPVQTEIMKWDAEEIKKIINFEIQRGGQVFFLHNKVAELEAIKHILQGLIPELKIAVAHGQMEANEVEDTLLDFISGDYDLLLCTTIVENGLDIPNANTIIINQAQNIGLSDLHQLRGRVGRSNKRAFCYLIVPSLALITEDARRRLKAIEAFSDLGSGFNIAMQDLDIRGAGNLLGAEQSGFITEMGFETYQKILAEALDELGIESSQIIVSGRPSNDKIFVETTVEIDQIALIPDSYLPVTAEKIRIYKELDTITSEKELDRYATKIKDRFGAFPVEVERLFNVVRIKILSSKLGFEKVIVKNGVLIAFFVYNPLSGYYKSKTFEKIIDTISTGTTPFVLKQGESSKLRILAHNVDGLQKAYDLLKNLL